MTTLKRLVLSVTLISVFAMAAIAGETPAGPCAPPVPGEMSSPPCTGTQSAPSDSVAPGETSSPPAANAGSGYSVTELALGALESLLSIY
jgi:hypothetical protein